MNLHLELILTSLVTSLPSVISEYSIFRPMKFSDCNEGNVDRQRPHLFAIMEGNKNSFYFPSN